jgi:hypothetical protein
VSRCRASKPCPGLSPSRPGGCPGCPARQNRARGCPRVVPGLSRLSRASKPCPGLSPSYPGVVPVLPLLSGLSRCCPAVVPLLSRCSLLLVLRALCHWRRCLRPHDFAASLLLVLRACWSQMFVLKMCDSKVWAQHCIHIYRIQGLGPAFRGIYMAFQVWAQHFEPYIWDSRFGPSSWRHIYGIPCFAMLLVPFCGL